MRAAVERNLSQADSHRKDRLPPEVPDHELLRHIGSGAYGEVWLARSALGTLRAIKVVYRANFKDERPYEREFNGILKYEPISRTHEGLVQVLHVGRNDEAGWFYYVMELADAATEKVIGESVISRSVEAKRTGTGSLDTDSLITDYFPRTLRSEIAREQRLPPTEAAQFALRLASALAHLHGHGLVHRDIKPSNVIFVGGQPKLADIGLVTDVGSSQSFVGTEGFIPPEGPGTPQADLYGLGKLLYELATGRDRMDFPQLPADVTRLPDGEALLELNEVMTRACAPEAKQRYASATELQAELNLFLAGRSLRRTRNVERNLARLKKFAVAACGFLALAAAVVWLAKNEERHASDRERQANERAHSESVLRTRAEAAENESRRQLYTALLGEARATVRSGEIGQRVRTLDAVRRAAAISNTVELRREAVAALALPDLRLDRVLPTGLDCTMAVLDHQFERMAVGNGTSAVEIRSVPDQTLLATLPASSGEPALSGEWSADGRFLAVRRHRRPRSDQMSIEIWNTTEAHTEAHTVVPPMKTLWGAISFHPTKPRALVADRDSSLSLLNLETGLELARFAVTGIVHQVKFSPDGSQFLVQHRIGMPWFTSLHDAQSGALQKTVLSGWIDGLSWHPRDSSIAFAARNGEVHVHDRETGETGVLGRHKQEARTAVFHPDGEWLFTGGEEQEIICWDLRLRQPAFTIGLRSARIQFHRDGRQCAIFTRNGVLLHSVERSVPCRELIGDLGLSLNAAIFSPDGRWLAASGLSQLGVWDLARDAPATIALNAEYAMPFFSPDSSELFASWIQDFVRWRITPGKGTATSPPNLVRLPTPRTKRVYSGHFTPDSLVLNTSDGLYVASRSNITSRIHPLLQVASSRCEVSPDGQWLASRPFATVQAFRINPWQELRSLHFEANLLGHVFSPGSDELAVASTTGVTFLDTTQWEHQRRFSAALDGNAKLTFMPDGRAFWLARDARTAALHDTQTFETLLQLPAGMTPLAVSPDGRHLAVSLDTRRLQVWDLAELRRQLQELGLDWAER